MLGQWEWIIMLAGFVGLLAWELVRTRRAIQQAGKDAPKPGDLPARPGGSDPV